MKETNKNKSRIFLCLPLNCVPLGKRAVLIIAELSLQDRSSFLRMFKG